MQKIKESLGRYANNRIPTGSFLRAVLSNDLKGACATADGMNIHRIPEIIRYCYSSLPMDCWGSPEKVEEWLKEEEKKEE